MLSTRKNESAPMPSNDASTAWRKDRDHFIHPYTDFTTFAREGSHVVTRARGVRVIDEAGREYLDGIAGLWCVNLGHGREEIAAAIAEQASKLQYYNTFGHSTNVPAAELAAELARLAPGDLNRVFFATGGSTANDTAIRFAHYYFNRRGQPNKKKVISRNDAYHGSTYFAATLTGIHGTKYGFHRIAEDVVSHVSAANMYRRPDGLDEAGYCDYLVGEFEARVAQLGPDNVAAFIAEPIMGAGGVLVAPRGYHRRMHEVCRAHDILYIADEVVTGFGRLGEWFASETRFGYVPDMIVAAKGISSGYVPLGATIISDRVFDAICVPQGPGGVLSHGYTYSGHPVACAAALKTIEIMNRENTLEHVRVLGPYFQQKAQVLTRHEIVGDVRGDHFMLGVELVADRARKQSFAPRIGATQKVFDACRERGVIVRPVGNVVILSPPLIYTQADVDLLIGALDDALAEVTPTLLGAR
jgi:putrescine---pyruvate transaminase